MLAFSLRTSRHSPEHTLEEPCRFRRRLRLRFGYGLDQLRNYRRRQVLAGQAQMPCPLPSLLIMLSMFASALILLAFIHCGPPSLDVIVVDFDFDRHFIRREPALNYQAAMFLKELDQLFECANLDRPVTVRLSVAPFKLHLLRAFTWGIFSHSLRPAHLEYHTPSSGQSPCVSSSTFSSAASQQALHNPSPPVSPSM